MWDLSLRKLEDKNETFFWKCHFGTINIFDGYILSDTHVFLWLSVINHYEQFWKVIYCSGILAMLSRFILELLVITSKVTNLQFVTFLLGVSILTQREKKAWISGLMLTCQNYVNLVIRKKDF